MAHPWLELPRRHLRDLGRGPRVTAALLGAFGFGCLAWVGVSLTDAAVVEARAESALERAAHDSPTEVLRESSAAPGDVEWPELSEGELVGRIEIDRIGVSAVVLEGVGGRTLRRAVGRIPGTGWPGHAGNVGLAGHRDSFFRELGEVSEGDVVRLTTTRGVFMYEVDRVFVVDPEAIHVLDDPGDGSEVLTLVSCYPFYYVGPAPRRFIVRARRTDPA